jgi:hypothetical protein
MPMVLPPRWPRAVAAARLLPDTSVHWPPRAWIRHLGRCVTRTRSQLEHEILLRPYSNVLALGAIAVALSGLPTCASARSNPCSARYHSAGSLQAAARNTHNAGKTLCATSGVSGDIDLGGVDQARRTTLRPVRGQRVTLGSVDASDTANMRIVGFNVTGGVEADGSRNLVVQRNRLANPGGYAVGAFNRPWGLHVIGNRFGHADFDVRLNWMDYSGGQRSGVVIAGNDFPGDKAGGYQITSIEIGGNPIGISYIGNTCHDNVETGHHQDCIQLVGAFDTLIEDNVFRNVSSAVMLPGHDGPNAPTNIIGNLYDNANFICDCGEMGHSLVVSNTFIAGDATGGGILLSDDCQSNCSQPSRITLTDNIFLLGRHWLVGGNLRGAQVHQDYNIAPGNKEGPHDIGARPRFVNAGAHNYHLAPNSPGIDDGTSVDAPGCDHTGRARVDDPKRPNRGGGARPYYDIGAYEFGATRRCRAGSGN